MKPCTKCAACCYLEVELTLGGVDDVPEDMITFHPSGYPVMRRRLDGGCIALRDHQCSIYNKRPLVCREFKRGGKHCVALLT